MFRVSYEFRPNDPEFANAPENSEEFDTQEEADAYAANVRAYGGRVTEEYELTPSQAHSANENRHCRDL